jgi:NAD(P)-dependent dehydrogenase (short-subunit alcohol dehydrogenase family)
MNEFTGRQGAALVTGGSGDFGSAITRLLAARGSAVAITIEAMPRLHPLSSRKLSRRVAKPKLGSSNSPMRTPRPASSEQLARSSAESTRWFTPPDLMCP